MPSHRMRRARRAGCSRHGSWMGLGHFAQDDYGSIFALRNAVREARHAFGEEIQRLSSQPTVEGPSADKAVWPRRLGLWATYLFAFLSLLGTSPATVALAALTLAFLWDFRDWRRLGRDPLVRVCLVFGGYVAVHSLIVYFGAAEPELTGAAADAGFDWLKLLLFIPFAYWVRGCPRRIGWLLLLALLGFTTGILRKIDWGSFDESFFHTRFEVYLPAISFGKAALRRGTLSASISNASRFNALESPSMAVISISVFVAPGATTLLRMPLGP